MRRKKQIKKERPVPLNCRFCNENDAPTYKKWEILANFLNDRSKILPKTKTGLCAMHQRKVAREIKRARYLALMPFIARPY